ncbi:hypothetical protein [Olsenella profusa]|uniref:Uncharacterized protein n=1 Tax=Olsenella profusa TaxID=138595 RepID=A0ABS2F3I9_9ACTN|nr:hypothetical protein [Olsenella profusa]MBM6775113.1 hypothetical protein [Olsenella profusa]
MVLIDWQVSRESANGVFGIRKEQSERAKEAEKRRDGALDALDESRKTLTDARAKAEATVSECLDLLSSMRSAPFRMRRQVRFVGRARKKFRKSNEIVEKQFARDAIAAGAAVATVGGVLGAVCKFRNEIGNLLKKKPPVAVAWILAVVAGAAFTISKIGSIFVQKSAKEWAEFTEECLRVADDATKASLRAKSEAMKISRQDESLEACLKTPVNLRGKRFRSFPIPNLYMKATRRTSFQVTRICQLLVGAP